MERAIAFWFDAVAAAAPAGQWPRERRGRTGTTVCVDWDLIDQPTKVVLQDISQATQLSRVDLRKACAPSDGGRGIFGALDVRPQAWREVLRVCANELAHVEAFRRLPAEVRLALVWAHGDRVFRILANARA